MRFKSVLKIVQIMAKMSNKLKKENFLLDRFCINLHRVKIWSDFQFPPKSRFNLHLALARSLKVGIRVCWICALVNSVNWQFHPIWDMVIVVLVVSFPVAPRLSLTLNCSRLPVVKKSFREIRPFLHSYKKNIAILLLLVVFFSSHHLPSFLCPTNNRQHRALYKD